MESLGKKRNIRMLYKIVLWAYGKKAFASMAVINSATVKATTSSGLTFMPFVSSSKNRSSPALAAGMGALLSRFFSLRLMTSTFKAFSIGGTISVN